MAPAINERIHFLARYYSPELTHTIRMMIEPNPDIRPDFK